MRDHWLEETETFVNETEKNVLQFFSFSVFSFFFLFDSERQLVRASARRGDRELAVNKLYKIDAGKQWESTKISSLLDQKNEANCRSLVGRSSLLSLFLVEINSNGGGGRRRCALLLSHQVFLNDNSRSLSPMSTQNASLIYINIQSEPMRRRITLEYFFSQWTQQTQLSIMVVDENGESLLPAF